MIPIPQFPMYRATLIEYEMQQVGFQTAWVWGRKIQYLALKTDFFHALELD